MSELKAEIERLGREVRIVELATLLWGLSRIEKKMIANEDFAEANFVRLAINEVKGIRNRKKRQHAEKAWKE